MSHVPSFVIAICIKFNPKWVAESQNQYPVNKLKKFNQTSVYDKTRVSFWDESKTFKSNLKYSTTPAM